MLQWKRIVLYECSFALLFILASFILRNRCFGFGEKVLCKSLIQFYLQGCCRDKESTLAACQEAFNNNPRFAPFIDFLASNASTLTPQNVKSLYPVRVGQFCNCALCSPLTSIDAAIALSQQHPTIAEHKFDGVRVQIHKTDDSVLLFGRSGEVASRSPSHA